MEIIDYIDIFLRDYFDIVIPDATITDVIEIFIIAFFSYSLLKWIKQTRAWMLLRGIIIIVFFFVFATLFRMNTILWLGEKFISVAFIAIVVVFQPELRYALEHLGRQNIIAGLFPAYFRRVKYKRFQDKTLEDLVSSCMDMSKVKTGALIVIEKDVALGEYIHTGIKLDSIVSNQLILNIFEKNTPLHDGAVIIRGDRIVAATCYLPLSQNISISKNLGTRHRAALGISEVSDSVTLVVSEETGGISVAKGGTLTKNLNAEGIRSVLGDLQLSEVSHEKREEENNA